MEIIDSLKMIKKEFEKTIHTAEYNGKKKKNGYEAKKSLVRSTKLINHLHEAIKFQIIKTGVSPEIIFPAIGETKGELKLTGYLKQKKQDICIKPPSIPSKSTLITWGPLKHLKRKDRYGPYLTEKIISVNIRSQLSSMDKNFDTLMERTFAESSNLHERYPKMCLGEVYLVLTHSYDEESMKNNEVRFKKKNTNLEKYISFFHAINQRKSENKSVMNYERCALLIVDMREENPILYQTTGELKNRGLVSSDFSLELSHLNINSFIEDLLYIYNQRFSIDLLIK